MRPLLLALALTLTGCTTLSTGLDATLDRAEDVSGAVTERALDVVCNRMSLRQWRETFAISQERVIGWNSLCGAVQSVPLSPGELRALPPTVERPA